MGFSKNMAVFVIVLQVSVITYVMADSGFPCDEMNCGRGTCQVNTSQPLGFVCDCDAGWKRTRDSDDDLTWLPCVIPNCTLDYRCQPAPPPVPEKSFPFNRSAFDPCYWAYCGEGTCTKNWTFTHTCQCSSGFYNLLNVSQFPCYSECTLGSDCSKLGIKVANSTSGSGDGNGGGSGSGNGGNEGTSFLPGKAHWVGILMITGLMMWK